MNYAIFVSGLNDFMQISPEFYNTNNANKIPCVSPPRECPYISKDILSFSTYYQTSVIVDHNKDVLALGSNGRDHIFENLPKKITEWTSISEDKSEYISAVCGSTYSLCLLKPNKDYRFSHLICYWNELYSGAPIYIDTKEHVPISLFGGQKTAAAIDDQGNAIIISKNVFKSQEHSAEIISLPNNEKSIYIACLEKVIFILSNNNKVYEYSLTNSERIKLVKGLENTQVINISGTSRHVFAVTDDLRVFGRGSNEFGQLCTPINKNKLNYPTFFEIPHLNGKNIVSAFAGSDHSLFINSEGKVYSCGRNDKGELLLENGPTKDPIFKLSETAINKNAKFCIAGCQISCVFVSCDPPPNSPNQKVTDLESFKIKAKNQPFSCPTIKRKNSLLSNDNFDKVYPHSSPIPKPMKKLNSQRVISKYKANTIENSEEVQGFRSQISKLAKNCQSINNQIKELQNDKMSLMYDLHQIGKIVRQLIELKVNPEAQTPSLNNGEDDNISDNISDSESDIDDEMEIASIFKNINIHKTGQKSQIQPQENKLLKTNEDTDLQNNNSTNQPKAKVSITKNKKDEPKNLNLVLNKTTTINTVNKNTTTSDNATKRKNSNKNDQNSKTIDQESKKSIQITKATSTKNSTKNIIISNVPPKGFNYSGSGNITTKKSIEITKNTSNSNTLLNNIVIKNGSTRNDNNDYEPILDQKPSSVQVPHKKILIIKNNQSNKIQFQKNTTTNNNNSNSNKISYNPHNIVKNTANKSTKINIKKRDEIDDDNDNNDDDSFIDGNKFKDD